MLKLILKEMAIIRLFWIPAIFIYALFVPAFFRVNLSYLLVNIILTLILVSTFLFIEDKYRTEVLLFSLPIKRNTIVLSRYFVSLCVCFIGLILYLSVGYALDSLIGEDAVNLQPLINLSGAAVFLIPAVILVAVFFPLYFRLGLGTALLVFPGFILGIAVSVTLITQGISLLTGFPFRLLPRLGREFLSVPYAPFSRICDILPSFLGISLFAWLLMINLAFLFFLSLKLSIHFYKKREF